MNIPTDSKRFALKTILIISAIILAYAVSFSVPFQFDDKKALIGLPYLHDIKNISAIINFDPYLPRPLFHFSLAFDWLLHRDHSWGFHLTNLLWHLLAVFLLWRLIDNLFKKFDSHSEISFTAAMLYGVHPALTESVTYIWGRSGIMSAALMLASMLIYLRAKEKRRGAILLYLSSILVFLLAISAKETAAILPLLLFAMELFLTNSDRLNKPSGFIPSLKQNWFNNPILCPLPYFIIVGMLFMFRIATYGRIGFGGEGSYIEHLSRQSVVVMKYLGLMIFPCGLSIDHFVPDRYPFIPTLLSPIIILALFAIPFAIRRISQDDRVSSVRTSGLRKLPIDIPVSIAVYFFLFGISPFLIVPLKDRMVERNLYLPTIGFCLLSATAISQIRGKIKYAVASLLILCYFGLTISRNQVWESERSLWSDAAFRNTKSARPLIQLGALSLVEGNFDMALNMFLRAEKLSPNDSDLHNDLGVLFAKRGDPMRAEYEFALAINSDPDNTLAHINYIRSLLGRGERKNADTRLNNIIGKWPGLIEAKVMYADAIRLDGKFDEAKYIFEEILRSDPKNVDSMMGLALIELQLNNDGKADEIVKMALAINQNNSKAHRLAGLLSMRKEQYDAAVDEYKKAVEFSSRPDPDLFADYGLALMRARKYDSARAAFEQDIQLRPQEPTACLRLALLEQTAGNLVRAKQLYLKAKDLDVAGKYKSEINSILEKMEAPPEIK